jgi:hypothetical protein
LQGLYFSLRLRGNVEQPEYILTPQTETLLLTDDQE